MTMEITEQGPEEQQGSSSVGVLLIHGLNGSLTDMREIEEGLRKHNLVTRNILLPGHGSQVQDMMALGWEEWATAVRQEYQTLRQRCERVFLIGHSLGGALALHTAAHEDTAGIVSMCSPLYLYPWMRPLIHAAKRVAPLLPTLREDVRDRSARQRYAREVYRWTPMRPVESMMNYLPTLREEITHISAPALIMVSTHDHVVPARDGRAIYHMIGSREKHLVTFHHSYHVIMKDHDREEVFSKTEEFILHHAFHRSRAPF